LECITPVATVAIIARCRTSSASATIAADDVNVASFATPTIAAIAATANRATIAARTASATIARRVGVAIATVSAVAA
jgi:hypothetical protein